VVFSSSKQRVAESKPRKAKFLYGMAI